jgi:hypothetical protein
MLDEGIGLSTSGACKGTFYGGHAWQVGPLPYHTAYTFPPAGACAPSDDVQNSVGKQG